MDALALSNRQRKVKHGGRFAQWAFSADQSFA